MSSTEQMQHSTAQAVVAGGGPTGLLLAEDLQSKGTVTDRLRLCGRLSIESGPLPSRFTHLLVLPQYEVEAAVGAWTGHGRQAVA